MSRPRRGVHSDCGTMAAMRRTVLFFAMVFGISALGGDCNRGPSKPRPPKAAEDGTAAEEAVVVSAPPAVLLATLGSSPDGSSTTFGSSPGGSSTTFGSSPGGSSTTFGSSPDGSSTTRGRTLVHLSAAGAELGEPFAELDHAPGGEVRAALLPDGRVAVAAPAIVARDVSFDGGLWIVGGAGDATLVAGDVVHASTPVVAPDGRVLYVRGAAGIARDGLRSDAFTVEAFDPHTGVLATLHAWDGLLVHLAACSDDEAFLYRVGPSGADLVAIDLASGVERTLLAEMLPFARDFTLHGGRLVFRERDETDARAWVVDALDLASGERERLYQGDTFALAPHVWPDGGVALSPGEGGLVLLGSADPVERPLGAGVDVVRGFSHDGRFVLALHTVAGALPEPFVIDRATGDATRLPAPPGARIALAGFAEAAP
jgi:hypothetical protein